VSSTFVGEAVPTASPASASPSAATEPSELLVVEDLTVRYAVETPTPVTALVGANLTLRRGERVAVVGESGSGKTTLGLAIAGFLTGPGIEVTAKTLAFDGTPITRHSVSRMPRRTPGLAMVFQDAMTSLDPVWTIGSQMHSVLKANDHLNRKESKEKARSWLARVGLTDTRRVLKSRPYELSGGMRQRAMLALALASQPKLLIADEPTSALDASLSREAMDLLVELAEDFGTSLLIISHDIMLSQEYAERTIVMYGGRIVEEGASATLAETATHPYTIGLLRCIPTLESAELEVLPTLASVSEELGEEIPHHE
jgi:ABC-type dipeptide/oligopeptide/nickel transport system ATPase component